MATSQADQLEDRFQQIETGFTERLESAKTEHEVHQVKAGYVGRKGELTEILKGLKNIAPDQRPRVGQEVNRLKTLIEQTCQEALELARVRKRQERLAQEQADPTLPGVMISPGTQHPLTQVLAEVQTIFQGYGFEVREGPEVETEYFNFEALNIPPAHPARDMQDTFYLKQRDDKGDALLLRTHTSPVQIHVMQAKKPPIRMIAPGAVYRRDSDVSHTPLFHQVEGLYVDEGVSFADLKGLLEAFLHQFFGEKTAVRFRPSYFPFTEPSAEVDISCVICPKKKKDGSGSGCRVCQMTGWLEVIGCGMVHPAVFRAVKYDLKKVSGLAFGMGIERLTMLKYRINDIRLFYENDIRMLEQFS